MIFQSIITLCIVTVCNLQITKLLFRRNNMIWRKRIVCKASGVASDHTRWYNKRILRNSYSFPRDLKITNWKLRNVKTRFLFSPYQGSQSPNEPFLSKTWSLTKNKLRHNLQLKADSVNNFSSKVLFKHLLKKGSITFRISNFSMKFLVEARSLTKNRLRHRLPHCHLW